MSSCTSSTALRSAPKVLLGITERGVQRKLLVAYALTFVLPTAFCLFCVVQLAVSGGVPFMTKLGLLIGLPSVTAMSLGGFLLLRDPLRCVEQLSADVEAVAAESPECESLPVNTWDEAHRAAYFITHVIDGYRNRLSTLGTRTQELQETNRQLRDVALSDPLTGLYNRRFALGTLSTEVQRSIKHGHPLSVLLIDPDDFGSVGVALDQDARSGMLRELGQLIDRRTRRLDLVSRFGSERFMAILLETGMDGAVRVAERIRSAVAEHAFGGKKADARSLTVSIGIGAFTGDVVDSDKVIELAESSLAIAQRTGANMVWA